MNIKINNKTNNNTSWVAYLKDTDPLAQEHSIMPSPDRIRIVMDNKFPLYHLMRNGKKLGTCTPKEIQIALSNGGIEIDEYSDRSAFIDSLFTAVIQTDRIRAIMHKALKIGAVAACTVATIAFATSVAVIRHEKK